jgi:hypothetical protein
MLSTIGDFGCGSWSTAGKTDDEVHSQGIANDIVILREVASLLPIIPDTRENADFLRHHLNGHGMNTLEGKKAIREIIEGLPEDSLIRLSFAIPSQYDPDISDPKTSAILPAEYLTVQEHLEFEGDKAPIEDYRVFQFPELS